VKLEVDRTPVTFAEKNRIQSLLKEKRRRECESLRLYNPLPNQRLFHQSLAYIRLLIGGNRGGKSRAAAVEFARAMTGRDPYKKYPEKDGKFYVVGKSLAHIGDTIYPLVFRAGAFKMIRDVNTGKWRSYRPWDEADRDNAHLVKPMPPLIPPRLIKSWAWENKAKQELSRVELHNGWQALFFSARGRMPQGTSVNGVWFDEEIEDSNDGPWFPEMSARLMEDNGLFMWSATPQSGYDQLFDLHTKGEMQAERYKQDPVNNPKPDIVTFSFDLSDNPHIPTQAKIRFLSNLSAEEASIRGQGDFSLAQKRVYPEFNMIDHSYPLPPGKIPKHWTKYAYVDPGHTVCAVEFFACPPLSECPENQPIVICYDELYIQNCSAKKFGIMMESKCKGEIFEAFYIDKHGSLPREAGSGRSIYEQYAFELRQRGIVSRLSGSEFIFGSDDRKSGVMMVHTYLEKRESGGARFRIGVHADNPNEARCPNLVLEMKKYRKKKVKGVVVDDPEDRGPTHTCQCVRYMAMSNPKYVEPEVIQKTALDDLFEYVKNKSMLGQGSGGGMYNFGRGS